MTVEISQERPDHPEAVALITELEEVLEPLYPQECRLGLSVERLIYEGVPFFVLRSEGVAAACGGVKLLRTEFGEIKRMYVRPEFRGKGFAKLILNHLAEYAQANGINLLRLETGIHQTEAIALYEKMGFYRIPPFGNYREDPVSLCYEKPLSPR